MDLDVNIFLTGLFTGILISVMFLAMFGIDVSYKSHELGQSICEEEYGMDFESYSSKVLECKPIADIEQYDGIKVRIGD